MKNLHFSLHAITIIVMIALVILLKEPAKIRSDENTQAQAWSKDHHLPTTAFPDQGALPQYTRGKGSQPIPSGVPPGAPATPAAQSSNSLSSLASSEQKSLWNAFSSARREVHPIQESRAERAENLGFDFYALHPKQNMTTRFGSQGVQIVSSNRTYTEKDAKHTTTSWQARMRLLSFAGKQVSQDTKPEKSEELSSRVDYRHLPGLTEWFDNSVEGMEHGYTIAARPANLAQGEQVSLEVTLGGLEAMDLHLRDESQSLVFMSGEREVLSYSKLLVVDANGRELPATMHPTPTGFMLAYSDTQAVYPVTVDPLITSSDPSWTQQAKLTASDAAPGDQFGFSVVLDGDTALIGVVSDDDGGSDSGSAYIFTRSGSSWAQQAKLTANDAAADHKFGISVALDGDTALIGASWDSDAGDASGSAYVFTRSGSSWAQQAKLTASDAAAGDQFGQSVALDGDTALIGAIADDDGGEGSGSAYVFTRSGSSWSQQGKLTAGDASDIDSFGSSVALNADTALIGAYYGSGDGISYSGSAYVFTRSGSSWSEQAKLTASDAATSDEFGKSVALDGDTALIGASWDSDASGSAYVFTRSGSSWAQQAKLTASDAVAGDRFGFSVALDADTALIGANYGSGDGISYSGSAYVFTRSVSSWSEQAKLTASDAANFDSFGSSVALDGDTALIGADFDSGDGVSNSGSVYIFRLPLPPGSQFFVLDHLGVKLTSGGDTTAFPGQLLGTGKNFTFRLTNAGEQDLDIQSITLDGADLTQFGLVVPDISSAADLSSDQSLDFTVSFTPSGSNSGVRNAVVHIASNDDQTPVVTFNISGLGLSGEADGDSDGMSDWGEFSMRSFGFDWQADQTNLVDHYYDQAHTTGLYTSAQAAGVTGSMRVFKTDPESNTVDIIFSLEESLNLNAFTPMTLDPMNLSIDGGNIRYQHDTTADKKFFRAEWNGQSGQ